MSSKTQNNPTVIEFAPFNKEDECFEFYESLPRFVTNQITEAKNQILPRIERSVEFDGKQFVLTIIPAQINITPDDEDSGDRHVKELGRLEFLSRFPGDFERKVEDALRYLADPLNKNFDQKQLFLFTVDSQLRAVLNYLEKIKSENENTNEDTDENAKAENETNRQPDEIASNQLKTALSTLSDVRYILRRGKKECAFHPISEIHRQEDNGENHYRISLSGILFGSGSFKRIFGN